MRRFVFLLFALPLAAADMVVFSFDRPMQLFAFLESFEKNATDCDHTVVIYRSSDALFERGYTAVKAAFPAVEFKKQPDVNPKASFKPMLMETLASLHSPWLLFAVDDIIVKEPFSLKEAEAALKLSHAYAFYLRLGSHINHCYMINADTPPPKLTQLNDRMITWHFSEGKGDWGYPNSLDMTLFSKSFIEDTFSSLSFSAPNDLEATFAKNIAPSAPFGIAFNRSKMVNIPVNLVQDVFKNRNMNGPQASELLFYFLAGCRIDIEPLQGITNKSPHIESDLIFKNN